LDSELTDEQRKFAEVVRNSGEALLAIINDILDFSKIEAGKLSLAQETFCLRTLIEDTNDLLALKAQEKGVEYVCCIHPEVPARLIGDSGRLRQVLTNVVGNAVKFTDAGEIAIDVNVASDAERQVMLVFTVSDTGPGIPQDRLHSVFEEFTQVDSGTTRRYGGTGLGLAIVRRLVELMGGEIRAECGMHPVPALPTSDRRLPVAPGPGTTFRFTILLEKTADPAIESLAPMDAALHGCRILVVDDNATSRRAVTVLLTSMHCRHAEASGADEAIRMLLAAAEAGEPFAVALVDMQMPAIGGETLGMWIKAEPKLRDMVMVLMASAAGLHGNAARLKAIGFAACVTKPVKLAQLIECLATVPGSAQRPAKHEPEKQLTAKPAMIGSDGRQVRILVTEDNVVNQMVALAILRKCGYHAEVVADGYEALKALETTPYDLVLMDCQMPNMDGYEASRRIRQAEASEGPGHGDQGTGKHIPIIAMTASALKSDREKCLEAGMDDFVTKPVNPKILAHAVEAWLPKRS
jgi:CheY-like chemotaxis protein